MKGFQVLLGRSWQQSRLYSGAMTYNNNNKKKTAWLASEAPPLLSAFKVYGVETAATPVCRRLFARGWNDELKSGVAAGPHIHTNTRFEHKWHAHTLTLPLYMRGHRAESFFLENYSSNAGKYTCSRISSHKLIINRQSREENSSNFTNNRIMLNNNDNKRAVDRGYSWLKL